MVGYHESITGTIISASAVRVADSEGDSSTGTDEQEDTDAMTKDNKEKTEGESVEPLVGMLNPSSQGLEIEQGEGIDDLVLQFSRH